MQQKKFLIVNDPVSFVQQTKCLAEEMIAIMILKAKKSGIEIELY
jgi:hypothetical protein